VQLSGAGVAAVAFSNNGLRLSQTSVLRVCSSRRSSRRLVVKAATVVTPKVNNYGASVLCLGGAYLRAATIGYILF
jgi:hypothetical protein